MMPMMSAMLRVSGAAKRKQAEANHRNAGKFHV
jgi:hypothetical protein